MYGSGYNTGTDYVGIEFFRWTENQASYYTSPAVRPGYDQRLPGGSFTWVQLIDADRERPHHRHPGQISETGSILK